MTGMQRAGWPRRRKTWALALLLVPLLGILIALQVRWLDDLAAAQQEVSLRMLETAAKRMAQECQATLSEVKEAVLARRTDRDAVAAALVAEVVPLEAGASPPADLPGFVVQGEDGARHLVRLDPQRLAADLFPALARSALGPDGLDTYFVSIVSVTGGRPPLYRSHPQAPGTDQRPDASAELRLVPDRWRVLFGDGQNHWTPVDAPVWVAEGETLGASALDPVAAPWRIELRHRAGSLELALARARLRNLALAGGLLALVVAGLALLWGAEQRARRLAEKELAFVAGVSHELRTPLAVVRTAASNLGRGVVKDEAQVADYGQLIEREATRVCALVERVLRFSTPDVPLVLDEVELEAVIAAVVERCQPWRDRMKFEVAVDVADDARTVRADGAALISALHNLIENAIKYGGQTITVTARRGSDVVVEVADQGPGVAAEDRELLFEPFYRGAAVRGGDLPGSGLGLGVAREIARAHGGRLELLATERGARGATFALHLPSHPNRSNGSSA